MWEVDLQVHVCNNAKQNMQPLYHWLKNNLTNDQNPHFEEM